MPLGHEAGIWEWRRHCQVGGGRVSVNMITKANLFVYLFIFSIWYMTHHHHQ